MQTVARLVSFQASFATHILFVMLRLGIDSSRAPIVALAPHLGTVIVAPRTPHCHSRVVPGDPVCTSEVDIAEKVLLRPCTKKP